MPTALTDSELELAATLGRRVRETPGAFPDLATLGQVAALGRPALRRLIVGAFHLTPEELLRRARVAAVAGGLLAGRRRTADLAALAAAAGWSDPALCAAEFRAVAGLDLDAYRRLPQDGAFTLDLPAGYLTEPVLSFLGRDLEGRAERVWGTGFAKALTLDGRPATLTVDFTAGAARCRLETETDGPLSPAGAAGAHRAALRLLGLAGADPVPFLAALSRRGLARLARGREGLRPPLAAEPFEGMAWAIVGQQINVAFAATLRRRLIEPCGRPAPGGLTAHPDAAAVAALDPGDLTPLQYSRRKAEYLIGAAREAARWNPDSTLSLDDLAAGPAPLAERRLLAVRGLGPWSAQYILLRALGFADCAPAGDAGLAAAAERFFALGRRPGAPEVAALLAPFSPYRSLATVHLWASLGDPP